MLSYDLVIDLAK